MARFILPGAGALVVVLAAMNLPGCEQGAQGDRCNPLLIEDAASSSPNGGAYNEDECGSGLACQVPPTCVIAVCCPTKPPYSDPNCACLANPGAACACSVSYLLDAGSGEDAGSEDAGTAMDAASTTDAPTDGPADSSSASDAKSD
jgi:hypothetical protein